MHFKDLFKGWFRTLIKAAANALGVKFPQLGYVLAQDSCIKIVIHGLL